MISRLKRPFLIPFLMGALCLLPCTVNSLGSYFSAFRNLCTSRMSDATDAEVKFLEQQKDSFAQMEAARLKMTYADMVQPLIMMSWSEVLTSYISMPFQFLVCKTSFGTLYSWFAKKIQRTQIIPAIVKGILSGAVIFAVNEVATKKLHPQWVKDNYYLKTLVSKICARIAVTCGILLLGSLPDPEAV